MAELISPKILGWCVAGAGVYLFVASILLGIIERKLQVADRIPDEIKEEPSAAWGILTFMMELLFFVVIPTIVYGFFASVLPLSGVRAGMAASLFAFVAGIAPTFLTLSVRIRLPLSWLLFLMLSSFFKLTGSLVCIAVIYGL